MTQYRSTVERVNRDAANFRGAAETVVVARAVAASLDLPPGRVGVPYHAAVQVQSGVEPFRFNEEFFPKGVGLVWDRDAGTLSGIPTRPVNSTGLMVVVSDANGVHYAVLRGMTLLIEP